MEKPFPYVYWRRISEVAFALLPIPFACDSLACEALFGALLIIAPTCLVTYSVLKNRQAKKNGDPISSMFYNEHFSWPDLAIYIAGFTIYICYGWHIFFIALWATNFIIAVTDMVKTKKRAANEEEA